MKRPTHALEELHAAKAAVECMRTSTSLVDFEANWKEFLRRLERVWNKAASHFSRSPKWNGWKGTYETARGKDPLLQYLCNARGAEEHTVQPISEPQLERFAFEGRSGHPFVTRISLEKGSLSLEFDPVVKLYIEPANLKLLPILNRGRTYAVPDSHLGKRLERADPIELALHAIRFYESLLKAAEERFCASNLG